ncbi:hypothetical protein MMC11_004616 [Xylographa trunciseda]|nr:hypothetical protein [Xylographa trunciseda]
MRVDSIFRGRLLDLPSTPSPPFLLVNSTNVYPSARSEEEKMKSGWRLLALCTLTATINFVTALDATTSFVSTVATEGSSLQAFWAGILILLTSPFPFTSPMISHPNFVASSRLLGCPSVLCLVLSLFAIGAIIRALSATFIVMMVGRVIQGIGTGGIIHLTAILTADTIPLRQRKNYLVLIRATRATGTFIGFFTGGVLAQEGTRRQILYLYLPVVTLELIGIVMSLEVKQWRQAIIQTLVGPGHLGLVIFLASSITILSTMILDGTIHSCSSCCMLVPVVLGLSGHVIFAVHEAGPPKQSQLPLNLSQLGDGQTDTDKALDAMPTSSFSDPQTSISKQHLHELQVDFDSWMSKHFSATYQQHDSKIQQHDSKIQQHDSKIELHLKQALETLDRVRNRVRRFSRRDTLRRQWLEERGENPGTA